MTRHLRPICSIAYDVMPGDQPRPGEWLLTEGVRGLGSAYYILEVRRVKRRQPQPLWRYVVKCERASLEAATAAPEKRWVIHWYPRERPLSPFGTPRSGS